MYPKLMLILGQVRSVSETPLGLAYWESDRRVPAIAREFVLPVHRVWQEAGPGVLVDGRCRDCRGPLIMETREAALRELDGGWPARCVFCRPQHLVGLKEAIARW